MRDTADKVVAWAEDRNLILGSTPLKQLDKLREEVNEIEEAIDDNDGEAFIDAIGDCTVVLTILAAQLGHTIEYCFAQAYEQIKDRRGRMIEGIFVKESDLIARGLDV